MSETGKTAMPAQTGEINPPPRARLSWGEKRDRRRRRRKAFEEVLGWLLVPALLYGGYLLVQALGGIPPAVLDFASELAGLVLGRGN